MVPRKIYPKIEENLKKPDILLIVGARQTGKTTILKNLFQDLKKNTNQVFLFSLEDPALLSDLNKHPENIFNYIPKKKERCFLLLDEIQYLENPTNFLKYMYDLYNETIKCIVSGSSAFYIDHKFKDSLAGRKKIMELFPFSFSEFLLAKEELELSKKIVSHQYFNDKTKIVLLKNERREIFRLWQEYNIYGGYPKVILEKNEKEKKYLLKELHQSFLKKDVLESNLADEIKFYNLIKLLASQTGNLINAQEISNTLGISNDTVTKYLYILQKSYIIGLIRPFFKNLRKELTKMPKIFFIDTGYRNSLLNIYNPLLERVDKGATLENMFYSELIKMGINNINYWRTQDKMEIDFIINENAAFEIKFSKTSFQQKKYKNFIKTYPEITFNLLTYQDPDALEIIDFTS